jgi:hypothetical protein
MPEGGEIMNDSTIYRWTGARALRAITVFSVEFALYFVRGPYPGVAE